MLRNAEISDRDFIFNLRNDPAVYSNCGRARALTKQEFLKTLTHDTSMLIIWQEDERVGYIRFDPFNKSEIQEIGIAILPELHSQGIATIAIHEGICRMRPFTKAFIAKVKEDNIASQRIFQKNGFKESGRRNGYIFYELN